jgi:RHH-type proline utilization regulon transcriptional repressor/proline dehydrogenase/delta 1-pyrroline-5-carboxylate dehydrogenase
MRPSDRAEPAFVHGEPPPQRDALRQAVTASWLADEDALVERLLAGLDREPVHRAADQARAADWVRRVRRLRDRQSSLDAFMHQYDLSSEEGVLLMCLAEALLRIPDNDTAEKLIADKLGSAEWQRHLGRSDSLFVNASTWGLMLTGRLVRISPETSRNFRSALNRMVGRSSEPVIRMAIRQAMRMMGHQFVMGQTIGDALKASSSRAGREWRHSFDMLGEAALTEADARRYLDTYRRAIDAIGSHAGAPDGAAVMERPGISVKLSALHPRYELAKRPRVLAEVAPRLAELALRARYRNIGLTIDAEEADRLDLSLDLFEAVFRDPGLAGWEGFGLAVQAYQKRAPAVLDWLESLAVVQRRAIPVRLVKGAYWDTEIKRSQELGLADYPVYSRKVNTDVAYLHCARRLLAARQHFYPQLATHNAQTISAVAALAGDTRGYEFQRLHGMGEALHEIVRQDLDVPCRVYAPVGSHEDLLPYLVRRLLENGANTSFVNRIFDENIEPEALVRDPTIVARGMPAHRNPALPLPSALYGPARRNSAGVNLADESALAELARALAEPAPLPRVRSLVVPADAVHGPEREILDPSDRRRRLGHWAPFATASVRAVVDAAAAAQPRWDQTPALRRAELLDTAAAALEAQRDAFLRLLVREAGKTLPDAIAELREAVDFLRYYAQQGRELLAQPMVLPGPTGEHNELQLHGRGVFVCIAPWNFPLAIFVGQIAAALVAGNTVIAKPAEQTNLIAVRAVQLLRDAGVPADVLQCVLGEGDVGAALTAEAKIAGVAFTGSVEVAQAINRALAARQGPIATLIAETGGQNAMIVDSSALPEQVVKDTLLSAFLSAGQRCSALRVLYLQHEIADRVIEMLKGAMAELQIGDPGLLATDVGPVIDEASSARLAAHAGAIAGQGRLIAQLPLPPACAHGSYFAPCAVEIGGIDELDAEYFGPMLHVVRYASAELPRVVAAINATGFGLTIGVHSRIETTWRYVQAHARVGNCYVNRGMTGAVVGVQPFGGEGLSGTGPKAGGPHYLLRFVAERTLTVNMAAVGGNARLLAQSG